MISSRRKDRARGFKRTRLLQIIPNAVTVTALCTGLSSIRFALMERWEMAVTLIIIAAVLDGLDGRVARLLRASSRFGAELDSLSDFIAFGVAPALVLYLYTLQNWAGAGWAVALLFSTAQALRLARFNSRLDLPEDPEWTKSYSVGVPAPAGAFIALLPLMSHFAWDINLSEHPYFIAIFMILSALLMVSRIPTFLIKNVRLANKHVRMILIAVAIFVAALFSAPWATLTICAFLYLASIPISLMEYKRTKVKSTSKTEKKVKE